MTNALIDVLPPVRASAGEHRRAIQCVASNARTPRDCAQLLDALGLNPWDGYTPRPITKEDQ